MLVNTRSKQDASPTDQKSLTKFEFTTITSKTGTSPIAWASNHWVPLYKQSPRKRLILPQKKPSTPLLPDSIIASNSSNSILHLASKSLNNCSISRLYHVLPISYLFHFSPLSCPANFIFISRYFLLNHLQFKHFVFNTDAIKFPANTINSIHYYLLFYLLVIQIISDVFFLHSFSKTASFIENYN